MSWMRDNALGVYISIPFCRSKCTFCNFASGVYPASEHGRYVERLMEEMRASDAWAERTGVTLPRRVDSVYLGGGTPTVLTPDLIAMLFAALRDEFELDREAEITVECAPGQMSDATLDALVKAGVNRMSFGVQSFVDREAHESGRLHGKAIVLEDLRRTREAGIPNLSVDLIAGLAGQTFASWDESVTALLETNVPHASVYMLEVDEDSRLGREMLAGGARYRAGLVPADDAIARMYETAVERLDRAGLAQYEISNFARPGMVSHHNLRYWQRRPYLGLGLDASSMFHGRGEHENLVLRTTSTDDLKEYLDGSCETQMDWVSPDEQHEEAWFLGLRLNAGVELETIAEEFGAERKALAMAVVEELIDEGLLAGDAKRVWLTPRGRMVSNDVFARFLEMGVDREGVATAS